MRIANTIVIAAAALGFSSTTTAAEKNQLGDLINTCAACHGAEGVATDPQYPHLAGQYADFLERAMLDYKSGKRKNPIMSGQVANLSEDDIEALAEYFAAKPGPLTVPPAE